jgi:hypothetical protein
MVSQDEGSLLFNVILRDYRAGPRRSTTKEDKVEMGGETDTKAEHGLQ